MTPRDFCLWLNGFYAANPDQCHEAVREELAKVIGALVSDRLLGAAPNHIAWPPPPVLPPPLGGVATVRPYTFPEITCSAEQAAMTARANA